MSSIAASEAPAATLTCPRNDAGELIVTVAGRWRLGAPLPSVARIREALADTPPTGVGFDCTGLAGWDSGLLAFVVRVRELAREYELPLERAGLPAGVQRLLRLAEAVPEQPESQRRNVAADFLSRLGLLTTGAVGEFHAQLAFVGEVALALGRFCLGRARFRGSDLLQLLLDCGAQALPIVSLIAFLVGIILAFVGAVQLELFGASIYVANLVGLGMARDMGAMMAAIIMAGRTGAAYAAQLGTMQVNEEIDALRTLGLPPMDFLVLPRLLALSLMMPLLCMYADFMGILGGALATINMSDVTLAQYFYQTQSALSLQHFAAGLFKSGVYGVLVALAGCLRGMQCGRSAQAVGQATTSAVVTAIVWIVVACAIITVLYFFLDI